MSCLLKSVMTDCIAFRHPSPKGEARFATKTLVCISQTVMYNYADAEVLYAKACTTIQHMETWLLVIF